MLLLHSNSTYFVKLVLLTLSGQRAAIGNAICRPLFFLPEILVFAHEQSLVHKYRILIRCLVLFFLISPFPFLLSSFFFLLSSFSFNNIYIRCISLSPSIIAPFAPFLSNFLDFFPVILCRFTELSYLCTRKTGTTPASWRSCFSCAD